MKKKLKYNKYYENITKKLHFFYKYGIMKVYKRVIIRGDRNERNNDFNIYFNTNNIRINLLCCTTNKIIWNECKRLLELYRSKPKFRQAI